VDVRRNLLIHAAFPIVVLVVGIVVSAVSYEVTVTSTALTAAPFAVFGAIAGRAWTIALPLAWTVILVGGLRLFDLVTGQCSVCGYEDDWSTAPFWAFLLWTAPVTFAVAAGVFIGWLVRRFPRSRARADRPARRAETFPRPR
jgi:hypothetical protein